MLFSRQGKGGERRKNSIKKKDDLREGEEKGAKKGGEGIKLPCIAK